ncbi:MAG: helicase-associated domain-containing protein [Microbacterium sp.]|uniref:helicase-associated domain-containing protein n=1 Tax=Microbacterium sp. TaxID=51671 RepID=UPI00271CFB44|nr:helicase-associated domain-containing protein [Microbacterium sp.]MDO8382611.1 helicase-associated domain-containing protein [Microbacterium sp.]
MTEGTRELAARLATLDDSEFAALLAARGVSPTVAWRDYFDAADALTDPSFVARALQGLTATELSAVARAAADGTPVPEEHAATVRSLGLTDASGIPLPSTSAAINLVIFDEAAPQDALPPADAATEGATAERAFTSVASLGDILIQSLHAPFARLGSGAIAAADRRRLSEELQRPEDLDALISLARTAGLLDVEGRWLLPTAQAELWLREPTVRRWSLVAAAWRDELPRGIRAGGAWSDPSTWNATFPADASWPARAEALQAEAQVWGLIAPDGAAPPWSRALPSGTERAEAELGALLPHEVDRIYLQNDLTAISPGPLASGLDVRLRQLAHRESHAQASSYRFTPETIAAALTEGETAESMLEFLAGLSLTGVPQPLEYLVRTTADKHGLVRVGYDPGAPPETPRTLVTSSEPQALETIAVDQSLRPLGLIRTGDGSALTSRVPRDTVLWALIDARYPAVAVDRQGTEEPMRRHRIAAGALAPGSVPPEAYTALIETLRASVSSNADTAWLEREIESAVRARAVVDVDVELPDGSTRTFTLEASGLGGGRLRGRERGTDVERTLPVSSVRGIRRV